MADPNKRVIAFKKKVSLSNPTYGKLQPLCYSDGTPIADLRAEFPNAGDIFVTAKFDAIPDHDLLLVRFWEQSEKDLDRPYYSQYITAAAENNVVRVIDQVCDLLEVDSLPALPHTLEFIPYKPTPFIFLHHKPTDIIQGPYKTAAVQDLGYLGWRVSLTFPAPTDSLAVRYPILRDRFLVRVPFAEVADTELVACTGLRDYGAGYEKRVLLFPDRVLNKLNDDPSKYAIDAMPDDELLSWVRRQIKMANSIHPEEVRRFRTVILEVRENSAFMPGELARARVDKALRQLEQAENILVLFQDAERSLVEKYLQSKDGEKLLKKYIADNKRQFLDSLQRQALDKARNNLAKLEQEAAEKRRYLEELEAKIASLKNEQQRATSDNITAELEERRRKLESEIEKLDLDRRSLEREKERLKRAIEAQKDTLNKNEEQLTARLVELSAFLQAMQVGSAHSKAQPKLVFTATLMKEPPANYHELVELVQTRLSKLGRHLAFSDVANYLVTIAQSRFTIFVGYPGVGKTSTVKLLAQALGLVGEDATRLVVVPVGRGWVSSRDFVGIFNPLNQEFQAADTGIYYALQELDRELRESTPSNRLPLWILLDEMNLSPVEHYLSDFLDCADEEYGSVMFGGVSLRFDAALRFIGTVNYDESTEPLTPRMISRAAIIYVDPPRRLELGVEEAHDGTPLEAVPFDTLHKLGLGTDEELTEAEQVALNQICEYLESERDESGQSLGRPTIVTPRLRRSVVRYCSAARDLIAAERGELGALDYAVCQRILPSIRGSGEAYARRLERLRNYFKQQGMSRSLSAIERILDHGAEFGEYDFFAF